MTISESLNRLDREELDLLRRENDSLRSDLTATAIERDTAERDAANLRLRLRDKEEHTLSLCASTDVLRGAVRETDAAWDREIEKSLELTARIATALVLLGSDPGWTTSELKRRVRTVLEGDDS